MDTKLDLEAVRHLFASLVRNCEQYGVEINSIRFKRDEDTGQLTYVLMSYSEPMNNPRTLNRPSQPIGEA